MEDSKILDLFFERCETALDETRAKYGKRLFHHAMNILANIQDAEECVSDTMLRAWESIPPSRPVAFGAFLAKITRNLSINKWKAHRAARRGGAETELLLSELGECISAKSIDTPEEAYESQLVTEAINDWLSSVAQATRVIFVQRYFYGESIRSICESFDMSESRVKSILFRARQRLGAYLEKEGVSL